MSAKTAIIGAAVAKPNMGEVFVLEVLWIQSETTPSAARAWVVQHHGQKVLRINACTRVNQTAPLRTSAPAIDWSCGFDSDFRNMPVMRKA